MSFSKEFFSIAEKCDKKLWLELRRRAEGERTPPSPTDQLMMRLGREVGLLAQHLYPTGIDCSQFGTNEDRAKHTQHLLESGASVLFEPTFIAERCVVRCDILQRDENGWHLIEVKSKRIDKWKGEYVDDVAFQVEVVERAGLPIASASLLMLNGNFVWDGEPISSEDLFVHQAITEKAQQLRGSLWTRAQHLLDLVEDADEPETVLKKECARCSFQVRCHPQLGVDSIVYLPKIKQKRVAEFFASGLTTIDQVPEDSLQKPERNAWHCFTTAQGVVTPDVRRRLAQLQYPITFLDFEYGGTALPIFPGLKCWDTVLFQWSAHTLAGPGQDLEHQEFLHEDRSNPNESAVAALLPVLRSAGSIVVYSHAENTQIKTLVERGEPGAEELWDLFQIKSFDLNALILQGVYFPGFRGLNSIKVVLPTLVPDIGYDNLAINNGEDAKNEWFRLIHEDTPPEEKYAIARHLREYCAVDTLGMVALYTRLLELEPTVTF